MRILFTFMCVLALGVMGCGETAGTGGSGGTAGSAGSGGTGGGVENIALTKCALVGYGDLQALWSTTKSIIHYIHHVQPLDPKIKQQLAALPDLDALPPIEELNDGTRKPRVLWSTFSLNLEPNQTQPERVLKVHVYQGLDEGIYGKEDDPATPIDESFPRGFSVDDGLYQGRIAVLDWRIDDVKDDENEVPPVGAGTFSVVGLGPVTIPPSRTYYSARVTIIRFPECIVPDSPPDVSVLCSDPKVPDTSNDNPYFDEEKCRFELTSFGLHLNLSSPLAEPTAVVIGFEAEDDDAVLENGSVISGGDGTTEFTASYKGQPVSFTVNFETGELTLSFAGEPEQACVYDTVSGDISDCGPTTAP